MTYYKITSNYEIEVLGMIQESSTLLTGKDDQKAFWHNPTTPCALDFINSKNLEFKLAYQLTIFIEDLGRDKTFLNESHGDFMKIWNRKKIEFNQFLWITTN